MTATDRGASPDALREELAAFKDPELARGLAQSIRALTPTKPNGDPITLMEVLCASPPTMTLTR